MRMIVNPTYNCPRAARPRAARPRSARTSHPRSGRDDGATAWYDSSMDALDDVLRVVASLNAAGVDYVVVGGVAVNLHGLIRATEDLDVFIRPDPENVERLKSALRAVWDDPSIDEIRAEDLCGDYPAVRYGPPAGTLYLDILARLGEATRWGDLEVEEKVVEGVRVRVATPRTLSRMKKGTVRPIDHADAALLRAAFGLEEED